jgi:hypothetical protein
MYRPGWTRLAAIGPALVLMGASAIARAPSPPSPGIYLEKPGPIGDDARVKLHAVIVQQVKQTGLAKMMVSQGFAKGGMVGVIGGASASVRAPGGDIAFYFSLDPQAGSRSRQMSMEEAMKMMDGDSMPPNVRSAEEFVLLHMTPKDDTRQAQLGTVGGIGGRGGGMGKSKDAVPCSVEKLGDGAFRVRPKEPLAPGEYAFTLTAQGQGGQLWDFGVDAK